MSHAWPEGGISVLIDGQRVLLVRPKEEDRSLLDPLDITAWCRRSRLDSRPIDIQNRVSNKSGEVLIQNNVFKFNRKQIVKYILINSIQSFCIGKNRSG